MRAVKTALFWLKLSAVGDTVALAMKAIRFLPLVFLVGVDGFAMFAPYALLVMTVAYLASRARSQPAPIALAA